MKNFWQSLRHIPIWVWVLLYGVAISVVIVRLHPADAIISFDEGFHGGAALFFREMVRHVLHLGSGPRPTYLIGEFTNGVTLYPPIWTVVTGGLSLFLGRSIDIFRLGTICFYIASILFTYWAVRRATQRESAGVFAALALSTVPMVVIYSHLMMLEVPLLLGIEYTVVMFFLTVQGLIPRKPWLIAAIALGFFCSSLTKLAAFPVSWLVVAAWMVLMVICFPKSGYIKKFWRWELLLYFIASLASIVLFVKAESWLLHANTVAFHETQTQVGDTVSPLAHALRLAWSNREFYLRDFRHMPGLTWVWFGSVALYALWKRTPFALLLPVWTLGIYAVFSAVLPQVPQYITSIYAPLTIGVAVVLDSLVQYIPRLSGRVLLGGAGIVALCSWQVATIPASEGYQWYSGETGQMQAAQYIAANAKPLDRVLTWHDGTTLALRLAGYDKNLQIHNAGQQVCANALNDSYEWGLSVHQPPGLSELDEATLTGSAWEATRGFDPQDQTVVYHNTQPLWPLMLTPEKLSADQVVADPKASTGKAAQVSNTGSQPVVWGCYRLYPYGPFTISFKLRAAIPLTQVDPNAEVVTANYSDYPGGDLAQLHLTAQQITQDYQTYTLNVTRTKNVIQGEIHLFIPQPAIINIESIVVAPQS
jgi:hypothetical protein